MSDTNKRLLPIYIGLFVYLIASVVMSFTNISSVYINVINPILIAFLALLVHFLTSGFRNRNHNKKAKRNDVIFILIIYVLVYYLSGLMFGFIGNSNSLSFLGIIKNFFVIFAVSLLEEYIRYKMVTASKKSWGIYLVTIFFILLSIDFNYLFSIKKGIDILQYVLSTIVPIVIFNITLTYLTKQVGLLANMLYRGVVVGIMTFSPILADHTWLLTNFFYLIMLMVFVCSIDYLTMLHDHKTRKKDLKKERLSWVFLTFACVFILFMVGVFKYEPIAIVSDSMYGVFQRGDAVIVEKIDREDTANIKVGDIIYYKHEKDHITHRVILIEERNGKLVFFTKGDNNIYSDKWEVSEDEIDGIVKFPIKYAGWPSIWLYELF